MNRSYIGREKQVNSKLEVSVLMYQAHTLVHAFKTRSTRNRLHPMSPKKPHNVQIREEKTMKKQKATTEGIGNEARKNICMHDITEVTLTYQQGECSIAIARHTVVRKMFIPVHGSGHTSGSGQVS